MRDKARRSFFGLDFLSESDFSVSVSVGFSGSSASSAFSCGDSTVTSFSLSSDFAGGASFSSGILKRGDFTVTSFTSGFSFSFSSSVFLF